MDKEIIADRLADIGVKTIEEVLKIADEIGEDRDKLVRAFADMMRTMAHESTFSEYKL